MEYLWWFSDQFHSILIFFFRRFHIFSRIADPNMLMFFVRGKKKLAFQHSEVRKSRE